jgi:hypothetical protein
MRSKQVFMNIPLLFSASPLPPKSKCVGGVDTPLVTDAICHEPLFENPLTDREGTLTEDPAEPVGAEGLPFEALQNLFYAFHKGLIRRPDKVQPLRRRKTRYVEPGYEK